MWIPVDADQLTSRPVGELAAGAVPDRWHGALKELGTHRRDGSWIVAGARDVAAALKSPALSVVPSAGRDGEAAELIARTARFSDGPEHRRRRELAISLLPPVAGVARAAGARTSDYLRRRTAAFDIMPLARQLPVAALAMALGLPSAAAEQAAALTGILCDAITPSLPPRQGTGPGGDAAARQLVALMASIGRHDEERVAAAISILFQARDATAALIGTTVLAGSQSQSAGAPTPAQRVEDVLRRDAPVQCTRRTASTDTALGDALVPAGACLWIFVATAERGTGVPATFGAGPHGCPGAAHAIAIARQVVTVLDADCWRPVPGQRIDLERRPNIRVPRRVLVARP